MLSNCLFFCFCFLQFDVFSSDRKTNSTICVKSCDEYIKKNQVNFMRKYAKFNDFNIKFFNVIKLEILFICLFI